MKIPTVRALVFCLLVSPFALQAQTWVGGSPGNNFTSAANWTGGVPASSASTDLVFGATSFPNIVFPSNFTVDSLTFNSGAPAYFLGAGTMPPSSFTLSIGAGGVTANSGGGFNVGSLLHINLTASQTWTTTSNVSVNSNVSGSSLLTKEGTGYLVLSGNNSYSGGTTINAGALYLGNTNSSSGTITVSSTGTLGAAFGDVTLGNAITLASGATIGGSPNGFGGSVQMSGTVTLADPAATLKVGADSDAFFTGTLTAGGNTALTVTGSGTGVAILAGSTSNITSVTADNGAVVFANGSALSGSLTKIHATNGGYVSVGTLTGEGAPTPPAASDFLDLITDKSNFNGVIGFDTDDEAEHPAVYNTAIDLTGFTANARIGSITSAVLSGTITPVGQTYNFGGYASQDGLLVVKSSLVDSGGARSVSVVSPTASGGAAQNGMVLILQGTNSFTGNISLTNSSVILDSAISGATNINLGQYSYAGYTEGAGFGTNATGFNNFAARVLGVGGGYTTTSILGIDSQRPIDMYVDNTDPATGVHTISSGTIDLSGFSSIYLGSMTGATIGVGATISAPSDGTLRLVSMSGENPLRVQTQLTAANGIINGLVVGMDGSEGAVVFENDNTFGGNITLNGGRLLVGDTTNAALSGGSLTVNAQTSGDRTMLAAAAGSASLGNNIAVTGTLQIGETDDDDNGTFTAGATSLELGGAISGTGGLYITSATTTLGGANTYSGGTFVRANTIVDHDTGLGHNSGYVWIGGGATLDFATSAPSIGFLTDANQFVSDGGSGTINFSGASPTLTINQVSSMSPFGTFSGQFTGNAVALVKNGGGQLSLTGNNAAQIAGTTINGGSLAIGDSMVTGATYGGNITINATGGGSGLFFRPGAAETMTYSGSISGAGNVTVNGSGGATTHITGGSSSFTGNTNINSGTLRIGGDNYWSNASATNVNTGATLRLDGDQTIKNLSGNGIVNLATGGKILTVYSVGGTNFTGTISGSGGLTKAGAQTFTISGTNSYTGSTLVSAGTLMVNSALTSQSVTVGNGAFLMGTGALHDVTLSGGGTYRPGLSNAAALISLDSLSMTNLSVLHMELGGTIRGTDYDALNIANSFTADGSLSVTFISSFAPILGNTFDLFDGIAISGTFDALNLQSPGVGLAWDTSLLYSQGVLSVMTAPIPEPSTYAMLAGVAALGLAAWRRRPAQAVRVTTRF